MNHPSNSPDRPDSAVDSAVGVPEPDTHCFDEDTGQSVWSHSTGQLLAYGDARAAAALAAQVPADRAALAQRLRAEALAVFDGPETAQETRDVIEWYTGSLAGAPAPSPTASQASEAAGIKAARLFLGMIGNQSNVGACKQLARDALEALATQENKQ